MIDEEGEAETLLADHRLDRLGLRVKLDKGFAAGCYCCYVEYDEAAARVGFTAARRLAVAYGSLLKGQLSRSGDLRLGEMDDPSRSGDRRRRRDLEATFLSFPVETADGRFRDAAVAEQFRVAYLRAGQQWDQVQAGAMTRREARRQDAFRQRLEALLNGDGYRQLDSATRERLLAEIPPLAFGPPGRGR